MLSMSEQQSIEFTLQPQDNLRLANLCGNLNYNIQLVEQYLNLEIMQRGFVFKLLGSADDLARGKQILMELYAQTQRQQLEQTDVHIALQAIKTENTALAAEPVVKTKRRHIRARGPRQSEYVEGMRNNTLSFGVGPAGTGKTYLAIACAVEALETEQIRKILLVRPAVEAGEKLGFLPGDLAQKIDPYLRPMYDALYEMLGFERVAKLMERNIIEIAPLAYMRGRTLNESYIVMDEAQNATVQQMKMFLTRIGFGSTAVVTGDITQIDLPLKTASGLRHALQVLKNIKGVHCTHFISKDVVRHPLVKQIVDAYANHENSAQHNS